MPPSIDSQPFGSEHIATLGQRIRTLREARGWSLQRLARESGLSVIAIRKLEAGDADPRLKSVLHIAEALGEPIDRLIASAWQADVSVRILRADDVRQPRPREAATTDVTENLYEPRLDSEIVVLGARGTAQNPAKSSKSAIFCYVLEGAVIVHFSGGDSRRLACGDSIHFVEDGKTLLTNPQARPAKFLCLSDKASRPAALNPNRGRRAS